MNVFELANSIGYPVELIAFEKGLTLYPLSHKWATHIPCKGGPVFVNPDDVSQRFIPILIRCRPSGVRDSLPFMLYPSGNFSPQIPDFALINRYFYHATAIHYISSALVYHVNSLVSNYEFIRDKFKDISASFIPKILDEKIHAFQGQPAPYYEFDSLITAARRAYDTCRYILWNSFGPGKGNIPRSFQKTLPLCNNLDPVIYKELEQSWKTWGSILTSYRDCIQHYVPVDFGLSTILLYQDFPGVWTAVARIPDNPDSRSKNKFTFNKGLDALKLGWYIANEALRVLRIVIDAVLKLEESRNNQKIN